MIQRELERVQLHVYSWFPFWLDAHRAMNAALQSTTHGYSAIPITADSSKSQCVHAP